MTGALECRSNGLVIASSSILAFCIMDLAGQLTTVNSRERSLPFSIFESTLKERWLVSCYGPS